MENNKRTTIDVPQLVRDTIERHDLVENGDHIVCGLSGGPDSVCLFHILSELSDEMGFTLSAVHVNHGFRPGAADEDQQYVRELCARLGIPLTVKAVDVTALAAERGETPEEAGRAVRYEAFAEEARRWETAQDQKGDGSTVRIAVAHNRNDQAETVLMRLIRGTGTDGLAGMPYRRRDEYGYEIIRPLLDADRTEIEAYCAGHDLRPCRDHTNDEPKYFRNSVRLKLLPFLTETFGPNIPDALLRLAANAAEDKGYFAAVVEEAIDEFADFGGGETGGYKTESAAPGVSFPLEILRGIHPAVRRRLITALFAEIGLVQDIEAVHLAAADALIEKGETGKSLDFPGGYRLEISYGNAVCAQKDRPPVQNCIQNCTKEPSPCVREYTDDSGRRVLEARAGDATALFDAAALNAAGLTPEWRTRRDGDFMRPKGMDGTKKLQDIFTDKKVPRADRDAIMLLAAGSEILWIPNIRISREYIIT
ncbi:MAG: tRNA lysidine(34) synthetase TilS [Clostridiales Family XIII bacterium]|jgi:tRNA(Ile)-lysidine synthase|nr:tRNA lysidine(34) synthetase TilS [Clostridiales Family XIII bacterium]